MPFDNSMPNNTSTSNTVNAPSVGYVGFKIFDSDNFEYFTSAGTYNLSSFRHSSGSLDE